MAMFTQVGLVGLWNILLGRYQRGSQDNLTAITVFLNWPRPPTFGDLDLLAEQQAKALEDPSSPKAGKRQRKGVFAVRIGA